MLVKSIPISPGRVWTCSNPSVYTVKKRSRDQRPLVLFETHSFSRLQFTVPSRSHSYAVFYPRPIQMDYEVPMSPDQVLHPEPLTSKRAADVAFQLLDIFLLFGAPCIFHSDNGSEFTAQVISELKDLWPQLHLVHGKPRHPHSLGSVETANADIKDMLAAWLSDNNTQDWSLGFRLSKIKRTVLIMQRSRVHLILICLGVKPRWDY